MKGNSSSDQPIPGPHKAFLRSLPYTKKGQRVGYTKTGRKTTPGPLSAKSRRFWGVSAANSSCFKRKRGSGGLPCRPGGRGKPEVPADTPLRSNPTYSPKAVTDPIRKSWAGPKNNPGPFSGTGSPPSSGSLPIPPSFFKRSKPQFPQSISFPLAYPQTHGKAQNISHGKDLEKLNQMIPGTPPPLYPWFSTPKNISWRNPRKLPRIRFLRPKPWAGDLVWSGFHPTGFFGRKISYP